MTPDWRAIVRAHLPTLDAQHEPEIVDELAQHLADLYDEALADGHAPEEALAIARTALPAARDRMARDLAAARESAPSRVADRWIAASSELEPRRSWLLRAWIDVRRDLTYAVRSLRRSPGYTAVAVLTLALGIGANSAIFAAVDAILLRPMPYAHADRLVAPISINLSRGIDGGSVSFADYADWRVQTDVFEAVALWRPVTVDLTGAGQPERISAGQVSPEYFRVLTATPVDGRMFTPADHDAKAARVTVISYGLWQRLFGGAHDVVGRTVRIGGTPHEIVGILPARVMWPENAALFIPLRPELLNENVRTRRDNMIFASIARLRDGVPIERGNAVLATIAQRIEREHPEARKGWTNRLQPLRDYIVPVQVRQALWVLLAAVGAVLLIGCANLAHLGLVRGLRRSRELSVRIALGASRWRLVRQLGVECLVLAAIGAAAGAVLAVWMIKGLVVMAPATTPFIDRLGLDLRVLGMMTIVTVLAVIVAGLVPAVVTSRVQVAPTLKDGSAASGSSARMRLLRHALVVAEIACAVVLVVGASLLLRSFARLQHVDPGVDVDRVLTARLSLPGTRYATAEKAAEFFERLTERLAAAPGVEGAAATSFVPIGGGGFGLGRVFLAEGWPEPPAGPDVGAQWNVVTPDYFRTVGIPVVQGRTFTRDDRAESTPVAIVSRSFATRMFGTDNPIGKRMRSWRDENKLREIVGIVGEVRYSGLDEREVPRQVYVPHAQDSWGLMNVAVRSAGQPPQALESILRREVGALDGELAVSNIATLRDTARDSIAGQRYTAMLLALLAATALALGAIGIYGVISHAVSVRQSELGLRAALGASPRDLYGIVATQALWLTALGVGIGVAGALAVSRLMEALLYDTRSRDPLAYAVTVATIVLVAALACAGPARRAARVDPLTALRQME